MSVDRILYDAMGVKVNASSYEIRQAYVVKSAKAELGSREFDLIKAAYRVLMNPNLRRIYDESGLVGLNNLFPKPEPKPKTVRLEEAEPSSDGMKVFSFCVSLEDAFSGGDFQVEFPWSVLCSTCKGTGTRSGKRHPMCTLCRGSGTMVKSVGIPGIPPTKQICEACLGRGEMEVESDLCLACYGRKQETQIMKSKITLPPGSQHGDTLKLDGFPDVSILLTVRMPDNVSISDTDLIFRKAITLTQSLVGFEFPVRTITGETLIIQSPDCPVPHGTEFSIPGHGYCAKGSTDNRGDLVIVFSVVLPDQKEIRNPLLDMLRDQLPPTSTMPEPRSLQDRFVECRMRDITREEAEALFH